MKLTITGLIEDFKIEIEEIDRQILYYRSKIDSFIICIKDGEDRKQMLNDTLKKLEKLE